MKAAVIKGRRIISCEDVEIPKVMPKTMLLKTKYCSICGTDLEYLDNQKPDDPLEIGAIVGHEFSAEVVEIGDGVEGYSIGDRVTAGDFRVPCGSCYYCTHHEYHLCQGKDAQPWLSPMKPGGLAGKGAYARNIGSMAEYFVRPAVTVQKIPEGVGDDEAALVEPLRSGVSGVMTTGLKLGDTAVIFGAGKIGLGTMLCAKAAGASPVIVVDLVQSRLNKALEIGADAVINAMDPNIVTKIRDLTEAGPDIVFLCTRGGNVLNLAADIVRREGIIGLSGGIEPTEIAPVLWWGKQIRFASIAGGFGGPNGFIYTSMRLIARKQVNVKPLISEIVPLREVQRAFDSMYSGQNITALLKP